MENFRLKVFRTAARHLNFRVAAEDLHLTQPAITQQVKALESELGAALFDRAGGKLSLTAAGKALLPFADQLAEVAQLAQQAVAETSNCNAGVLKIAASQTIGQYLLPRLVAAFLVENPKVAVSILGGNTQTVLEALSDHRAQIALIEGPALRQDVHVEPFMEDHMVCVVPAGHPWADSEVQLEQIKGIPIVTRELGSGSRRIVEQALENAGLPTKSLNIYMTFDSTEGMLSAVEAGLGIAFVSRWAVRNQLALGTLHIAHVRGLKLSRRFSIATPAGPEPGSVAGAFHRFILERAEELVPRATGRPKSLPKSK
jgi:DNA-binding transcriptional LysR family regulator